MYVETKEKGMPTFEASSIGNFKLKAAAAAVAATTRRRHRNASVPRLAAAAQISLAESH